MSFEFKVVDIFHVYNDQTAFAGEVLGHNALITRGKAQVLVDNEVQEVIEINGEYLFDRRHPLGYRAISTEDKVTLTKELVKTHDCRLKQID